MPDTPTPPPARATIGASAETAHRQAEALRLIQRAPNSTLGLNRVLNNAIATLSSAVPAGPAGEGGELAAGLARIQGALVRERDGWAHSVPVRACFDRVLDVLDEIARRPATPQQSAEAAGEGGRRGVDPDDVLVATGEQRNRWANDLRAVGVATTSGAIRKRVDRIADEIDRLPLATASPASLAVSLAGSTTPGAGERCDRCGHATDDHVDNGDGPTCARMVVSSIAGGADECGCRPPGRLAPAEGGEDPRVDVLADALEAAYRAGRAGVEGEFSDDEVSARDLLARVDALASRVDTPAERGDAARIRRELVEKVDEKAHLSVMDPIRRTLTWAIGMVDRVAGPAALAEPAPAGDVVVDGEDAVCQSCRATVGTSLAWALDEHTVSIEDGPGSECEPQPCAASEVAVRLVEHRELQSLARSTTPGDAR